MPRREQVPESGDVVGATLGSRIRLIRSKLGLTLDQLSSRAGLSKSFLWEVEQDRSPVSSDRLLRLSDALGASPDFLLRGTGGRDEAIAASRVVEVPAALSEAAEEVALTHQATMAVLAAHRALLARRGLHRAQEPTKEEWLQLIQALNKFLADQ